MKLPLIFILFFFITAHLSSQERKRPPGDGRQQREMFEIVGQVYEKNEKIPLEFTTVIVKPLRGPKIFGGMTDDKGNFLVEAPKGRYNISFEFLSFKTITLENIELNKNLDLGEIFLEEDSEALEEVEVIAEKSTMEVRLDKKIYNVGKDMTVKGGTASDVLDNVPSVTVDAEGVVSLRGNENVRILCCSFFN